MNGKMTTLDDLLQSAVDDGTAPGIVVIAKDKDGKVDIAKAFSSATGTPYTLDTIMELSSMSKLPTCIAALQLVDKGLITLDEDISPLLPSLAKQGILLDVAEDGTPTTRPRRNPITLRGLITHSAGAGYHFLDARLGRVKAAQGNGAGQVKDSVDRSFDYPLLYEPGEGWAYGSGTDRVGQVVERVSGVSLDAYMRQNVWGPLGRGGDSDTCSATFLADDATPEMRARRVPMAFRGTPDGPAVEKPGAPTPAAGLSACYGGHGMVASMADYFALVHSLLVDDGKLLSRQMAAQVFEPQLSPASKRELLRFMGTPAMQVMFPAPAGVDRDYGLGGLLVVGDEHEYWRKGALMWGGAANLTWFIDRAAGVCGVFGAQVLSPGDPRMRSLINAFQADVYRRAGKLT
ncbi:beta-lactamase family protein [Hypoxylon sp. NC1633]|nr:beta-lactamase family protein [Hypoxylon sp. NC1633]